MSSIRSVILGLLDQSSVSSIYKGIIRNMLPNMSEIQMGSLLATLNSESTKKQIITTKKNMLVQKYGFILDKLEENSEQVEIPYEYIVKASKKKRGAKTTTKTSTSLSDLRKQVGR